MATASGWQSSIGRPRASGCRLPTWRSCSSPSAQRSAAATDRSGFTDSPRSAVSRATTAMFDLTDGSLPKEGVADALGLQKCLRKAFAGRSVRLVSHERLKTHVHRLLVELDGAERSLIVKWSDPVVAHRCWL